jgi:hypothetical protein
VTEDQFAGFCRSLAEFLAVEGRDKNTATILLALMCVMGETLASYPDRKRRQYLAERINECLPGMLDEAVRQHEQDGIGDMEPTIH